MVIKHIGFNLQAALNEKAKAFAPPKPGPQLSVPAWKEGSEEWCRAIAQASAAKEKQQA